MPKYNRTGFYNSSAWVNTRRNYTQSVGGLCERCLAEGKITPSDVVHHKIPLTDDNIKDLNISLGWCNLQALCSDCHALVHSTRLKEREARRYTIDNNGRVRIKNDTVL